MKTVAGEGVDLEFLKGGMWPKMRTYPFIFFYFINNINNGHWREGEGKWCG